MSNACHVMLLKEKKGISFIGPSAHAITGMGDKIESKRVAKVAGVHIIPGCSTFNHSEIQFLILGIIKPNVGFRFCAVRI